MSGLLTQVVLLINGSIGASCSTVKGALEFYDAKWNRVISQNSGSFAHSSTPTGLVNPDRHVLPNPMDQATGVIFGV